MRAVFLPDSIIDDSNRTGKSLFPLDESLNMPKRKYTYGLRECVNLAVCQNAFDASLEGLLTLIAGKIPKRQAEELVVEASTDSDAFYAQRAITPVQSQSTVLVMSQDGNGITLRHDDLREATRKAAEKAQPTLSTRLTSGEKRHRKRMATVAAVYDVAPHVRKTSHVIRRDGEEGEAQRKDAPKAENKRVWASIEKEMEGVTEAIVHEALRRDPTRDRPWVMLVDGHKDQIKLIKRVFNYAWSDCGSPTVATTCRAGGLSLLPGVPQAFFSAILQPPGKLPILPFARRGAGYPRIGRISALGDSFARWHWRLIVRLDGKDQTGMITLERLSCLHLYYTLILL